MPRPSWPSDPTKTPWGGRTNEALNQAWTNFEKSQPYRLAKPEDRAFPPAAIAGKQGEAERLFLPYIIWWGIRGFRPSLSHDPLIAIVVDPARTDEHRYGLVVLAAPEARPGKYQAFWVLREVNLSSAVLSPASGGVYVAHYPANGAARYKEIVWDASAKQFKLPWPP